MIKRITAVLLTGLTVLSCAGFLSGCSAKSVTMVDVSGDTIALFRSADASEVETEAVAKAYADTALHEAREIIAAIKDISLADGLKELADCRIETFYDAQVSENLANAVRKSEVAELPCGAAMTDNQGHLIACYSTDEQDENGGYLNLAIERQAPYSTLKPLCVYAPAMDSGMIDWSSVYEDKPYKQIPDQSGEMKDWPQNSDSKYSSEPVTVAKAVLRSLNTVPVQVLHDYGVSKAIGLMEESFGMPLEYEYSKASSSGEDEVIGNIALGYTYAGLSPVELAGYYSVFAAKGVYLAPTCVKRIVDKKGETLYEYRAEPKQVYSEETAFIMNNLLRRVANVGGTGEEAYLENAYVAGKTGTGESDDGHWFVGTVPQYSCAVWHGGHTARNASPAVFHNIMQEMSLDPNADYPWCNGVEERAYCEASGKLPSSGCTKVDIGYYPTGSKIEICREHQ